MQTDYKPTPVDSAHLILKLYELRREEKMREARIWIWNFKPKSFADVQAALASNDGAKLRMVLGYWDMAASLVHHGAIDETMFNDANGEFLAAFSKVQPYLKEYREMMAPHALVHLEKLVHRRPGSAQVMEKLNSM